jgi:hypothetical protein
MRGFRPAARQSLPLWTILVCVLCLSAIASAANEKKPKLPTIRWDEERPGCTFSRTADGKYHYGLWSGDYGVTLSVDSQEIEKVHRRHEPFFGVLLTVRYGGRGALDVNGENATLEFVKHFKVVQAALDSEAFSENVQHDADDLDHQTAREIEKHPEAKEKKEAYVRAFQKDAAELLEFVSKNSLRSVRLDPAHPEVSGWVLFSTSSKWIGSWKKQEEFVLRVPIEGKIFEFPFKLPPKEGELLLRKRE